MKKITETLGFFWDLAAYGLVERHPNVSLAVIIVLGAIALLK